MGSEPYLGQIKCFGFTFAPVGWAMCNGQILSIQQNTALFSLLGTTYGGNGQTTFALPDLRGRAPIHVGQGPGLSPRALGSFFGEENHTLINLEMPAHNHTVSAGTLEGDSATPSNAFPTKSGVGDARYGAAGQAGAGFMAPGAVVTSGSNQPHTNLMPYLAMNYCIALQGIFPPRS